MKLLPFKNHNRLISLYFVNSFIVFIWWLVFNPGFFAPDSLGIINKSVAKSITSEYTQVWGIFVYFFSFGGKHPELATLFFSQLFSFSFTTLGLCLFKEKIARMATIAMAMTPTFGALGITLWHDVPATSGLMLGISGFLKYKNNVKHSQFYIFFGLFFSTFRHNTLFTLSLCLLLAAFLWNRSLIRFVLLSSVLIGSLAFTLDSHNTPTINVYSDGAVNWMRYDISCYASDPNSEDFFSSHFNDNGSRKLWESKRACTWFNDSAAWRIRYDQMNSQTVSAWFSLFLKNPISILKIHLERNSYLVPIPFYGLPHPPFLHTKIDDNPHGIHFWHSDLSQTLRIYPRIWNYFNFIFGWSGLWLLYTFIVGFFSKNKGIILVGILGLTLNLGLFVTAVIPDARYTAFTLLIGQLVFLSNVFALFNRYLSSRNKL